MRSCSISVIVSRMGVRRRVQNEKKSETFFQSIFIIAKKMLYFHIGVCYLHRNFVAIRREKKKTILSPFSRVCNGENPLYFGYRMELYLNKLRGNGTIAEAVKISTQLRYHLLRSLQVFEDVYTIILL